jgi:hypothetical protein
MKKWLSIAMFVSSSILSVASHAEMIGRYYIEGVSAQSVGVPSLNPERVYAISCSASFDNLKRSLEDVDKLSLHVNPGEVTDRYGRHGVKADYDFGVPVGVANFYAMPDASGNIDFSIVNTLARRFDVLCNINLQN